MREQRIINSDSSTGYQHSIYHSLPPLDDFSARSMSSLAFNFQRNVTSKGKTRLHARPSTIEKDLMYEHSAPIGSETEPKIQVCTTLFTLTPQLLQIVPQILIPPHRLQMTRQRSSQPSHMQEIDGAKPTESTETASLAATVCPFGRNFGIRGFELVSAA